MIDLTHAFPRTLSMRERLLRYFNDVGQAGYYLANPFPHIEQDLELSHSSLKRYLKDFQDADVLKFNLDKRIVMLNPRVFQYPGMSSDVAYVWRQQYNNFIVA